MEGLFQKDMADQGISGNSRLKRFKWVGVAEVVGMQSECVCVAVCVSVCVCTRINFFCVGN